jgi:lactate permease
MELSMTHWFLVKWLLAFSPIAMVLFLMVFRDWGGGRAGAAGWFTALIAAALSFGAHPELIAYSQMKGVLLSLNVLYIIWAALLLYHVVNETGAIKAIGIGIQRFSGDKAIQLLIFGWIFSSFLQGVAGYGVPIAVVAPLLVGLGFTPVVAVAAPAIGHSWSVTFGSMGASFQALMAVTGLDDAFLGPSSALLLGFSAYLCAIFAIHVFGGWKLVRHSALAILIIGTVMAGTQYILAVSEMWTLGGFGASLMGMCAALVVSRLKPYRTITVSGVHAEMSLLWAFSAYIILIAIISAGELIGPVKEIDRPGEADHGLSGNVLRNRLGGPRHEREKHQSVRPWRGAARLFRDGQFSAFCGQRLLPAAVVAPHHIQNGQQRRSHQPGDRQHGLFRPDHGSLRYDQHPG